MALAIRHLTGAALKAEWEEVLAAKRNPEAFRTLYDRYYTSIYQFVFRRTNDQALCADITAQTFLKALENLEKYRFRGVPFGSWLFRIASNEIRQHFRRNKRHRVVAIDKFGLKDIVDDLLEPKQDLMPILVSVLDELREEDLCLVEMRYFEQRPFRQIAEILNITENNAKVKMYRLLEKLQKSMKKKLEGRT